jgi:hypothetical protein
VTEFLGIKGGRIAHDAATAPDLVSGIVEIGPFTRKVRYSLVGMLRVKRYRRGALPMAGVPQLHSLNMWLGYLDVACQEKPADYAAYMARCAAGETWRIVRCHGWPGWLFWLRVVVMLAAAVLNTAVQMISDARTRRPG